VSNRSIAIHTTSTHFPGTTTRPASTAPIMGSSKPAAAISREIARFPAGDEPYPVGSASPNPPHGESGAPPGPKSEEHNPSNRELIPAPRPPGLSPVSSVPRWQRESYASGRKIVKSATGGACHTRDRGGRPVPGQGATPTGPWLDRRVRAGDVRRRGARSPRVHASSRPTKTRPTRRASRRGTSRASVGASSSTRGSRPGRCSRRTADGSTSTAWTSIPTAATCRRTRRSTGSSPNVPSRRAWRQRRGGRALVRWCQPGRGRTGRRPWYIAVRHGPAARLPTSTRCTRIRPGLVPAYANRARRCRCRPPPSAAAVHTRRRRAAGRPAKEGAGCGVTRFRGPAWRR
jgi:hypothetical protein